MNIFSDQTGHAILVPDVGFPFSINVEDWGGPNALNAIITNFGLSASGNFQFMHTLRNFVYVYVFGERISEINVGGLAMAARCESDMPSGVELLWEYYQQKKIATNGTPVNIAIGTRMSFQGFLTGFNFSCTDPNYGLSQWAMRFHFHPPEGDIAGAGAPTFIENANQTPLQPTLQNPFLPGQSLGGTQSPTPVQNLLLPPGTGPSQFTFPVGTGGILGLTPDAPPSTVQGL